MIPECPNCQAHLVSGFVELRNTFSDFLFFGWSHLVLTFSNGEGFDLDFLEPSSRNVAYGCEKCGALP